MNKVSLLLSGGLAALALAAPACAEDKASIDQTNIIGNKELPKVLYIVPWKRPMPDDLSARPMASVLDEALAPIDRDVFRRQVRYDALVQPQAQAPVQAAAAKGK
jgi:hypothetical protein